MLRGQMSARWQRYLLLQEPTGGVVRVTRSAERFDSALELRSVWTELNRQLDPLRNRGHALLVDTRDAPPRNDPEFESVFARLRAKMFVGFQPRAVLVRSTAGVLQARRHSREDGVDVEVFAEETDALAYLSRARR
jgi:hypothetical protein